MTSVSGKRRPTNESRADDYSFPIWRPPVFTDSQYTELRRAARAYAERNRSDPFAFGRIMCHMLRGFENASEVYSTATRKPETVS